MARAQRNLPESESVGHDASWDREVRAEVARSVVKHELTTNISSLIVWIGCAMAALALPYAEALILPLALRLCAIPITAIAGRRLRLKLDAKEPFEVELHHLSLSLAFSGFAWGLLLWSVAKDIFVYPSAVTICTIITVATTLTAAILGPLPRLLFNFLGGFIVTVIAGILFSPSLVNIWVVVSLCIVLSGILAFSFGTARTHTIAAETLVENRRLGEELATALAHAEFLLQRDPLTGLLNRRAFLEGSEYATHCGAPSHILAIDLDHFKAINDSFGHGTGDRVLIATGDVLREIIRTLPEGPHCAVRLGGEEFAVLISGVDRVAARSVAEVVRKRIGRIPDELDIAGLTTSTSIGVTEWIADEELEAALQRADRALYKAKEAGRNQVMLLAA